MTLRKYLEHLNRLAKEYPDALDYQVVYSSDDEGNDFQPVHMQPCVGMYEDREFEAGTGEEPNAVCLN